ncbi:MAG: alpha/beta hydrolase [candidate division FCPU426 bacterium]
MPEPALRFHGRPPFTLAVLHGGPGAAGEAAPVARALARKGRGVLEPFQTRTTPDGQVRELAGVLARHAASPLTVVGFSWGAWLAWLLASKHPRLVGRLVLIGSGGFRPGDGLIAQTERVARMNERQRLAYAALAGRLPLASPREQDVLFASLGRLMSRVDAHDPFPVFSRNVVHSYAIYRRVWPAADRLRASGRLLACADRIHCPVIALHGDRDPHPAEGVRLPLSERLADFRFVLLPRCGHKPWIERQAREAFYARLNEAVAS